MIRKRTLLELEVDRELISKGKDIAKDFDESQALHVPGRKRESKLISIRLPMDMIRQLRAVAMQKGNLGYQQLIRLFLSEALSNPGSELQAYMGQLPHRVFVVRDVSLTSSSLGAEFGRPDYKEVGEANQFQFQER